MARHRIGQPLAESERKRLGYLVQEIGERNAAELLEVSRQTVGRALGGLALQRATLNQISHRLDVAGGGHMAAEDDK